ncbi:TPA: hypothetical protein N0F65_007806 [Lagenidium giganteum]|uniref:EGF-like domain-containing protein n=1 Tax=Lagenidium giganteum TaxID=4803 RepID=A0AAV2Z1J7_9STRA|nr:TPA: hypothetical protein N0F65_007806 [Lagenidium giganteum]
MKNAVIVASSSIWWRIGALSGASAVMLGAFGAHGLQSRVKDPKLLKTWETAAHYQLVHSAVFLAVPLARRPNLVGGLLLTGTVLFSGSLYALVLSEQKKLAPVSTMRKWCIWAIFMAALASPALAACPNKCSGHGKCTLNDVCDCMQNWTNGDCSGRVCPFQRAWQDTAIADNDAHYYAECSNRGVCDRDKGICDCDTAFTGSGCRRLVCPDDCSGHGTCNFIEELAKNDFDKRIGGVAGRKYTLWDQEKIMGCKCDPWFEGHNCAKRVCPKGDDPLTPAQNEMVQAIVVSPSVEGYLTYYDPYGNAFTTGAIAFDTAANNDNTCALIQTALNRLPNNALNTVTVSSAVSFFPFTRYAPDTDLGDIIAQVAGGGTTANICLVYFKSEPGTTGYQNLLGCNVQPHTVTGMQPKTTGSASATCTVYEVFPGATAATTGSSRPLSELAECSNRGICDRTTGICKCYSGHMGLACQKQEALV